MRIRCYLIIVLSWFVIPQAAHAQYCRPNIPASTPDSLLMDNGNGTITDRATGLMWKKCFEGGIGNRCDSGTVMTFTWQTALQQPGVINSGAGFAGYHDWRLPNIKELTSIVERKCIYPAINLTRFPNDPYGSFVWSGSPYANNSRRAWFVDFYDGGWGKGDRGIYGRVRLVHGGQ